MGLSVLIVILNKVTCFLSLFIQSTLREYKIWADWFQVEITKLESFDWIFLIMIYWERCVPSKELIISTKNQKPIKYL